MGKTIRRVKGVTAFDAKGANQRKYGQRWRKEDKIGCRCSYCTAGKGHHLRKKTVAAKDELQSEGVQSKFTNITVGKFFD